MATLYITLGLPGAGKTTAAKCIRQLTGAVHLWADHERRLLFGTPTYAHEENVRLYDRLNKEAGALLGEGKSVVYDTNFGLHKDRELMRRIAARHHADVVLVWVVTPAPVARERATDGAHDTANRVLGNMPASRFEHIQNAFEPPAADESYVQLDGTRITCEYVAHELGLPA